MMSSLHNSFYKYTSIQNSISLETIQIKIELIQIHKYFFHHKCIYFQLKLNSTVVSFLYNVCVKAMRVIYK